MSSLIRLCYKSACFLVFILPRPMQLAFGDAFGIFAFDVLRVRRKLVLEHLAIAFPEKSAGERIELARDSFRNLGRGLVEYCNTPFLTRENYQDRFQIEGREHVEAALKKGKGAFGLSLHMGNGDYGMCGMVLSGMPVHLISKHFKAKWLDDIWFGLREEFGAKFIPEEKSTYQILRALKGNGLVMFVLDQFMGPPVGVKTTFFGRETGTAMGLALFAARSEVPVLPIYACRREDGVMRIIIEPPVPLVEGTNLEETVQKSTQSYTDHLEEIVRRHPDQWMWLHRRWKTFEVR